mmetsp:Transcript_22800/g.45824  ORF Transcript_22800/g.45824 Transcript_22800/m.45824 type:complete len:236 (-) Transcript_22800:1422-2129(-)
MFRARRHRSGRHARCGNCFFPGCTTGAVLNMAVFTMPGFSPFLGADKSLLRILVPSTVALALGFFALGLMFRLCFIFRIGRVFLVGPSLVLGGILHIIIFVIGFVLSALPLGLGLGLRAVFCWKRTPVLVSFIFAVVVTSFALPAFALCCSRVHVWFGLLVDRFCAPFPFRLRFGLDGDGLIIIFVPGSLAFWFFGPCSRVLLLFRSAFIEIFGFATSFSPLPLRFVPHGCRLLI